ncbi:unnamed protein product [Rhizophagus irregularis]|uniref:Uncharacterized protein n=1 Tax=Rhizophagus irregularis TaxID=588596 RepID=A0A916DZ26_9GLOM|nr:unnamed protein product [Rhizophagus irregularis]
MHHSHQDWPICLIFIYMHMLLKTQMEYSHIHYKKSFFKFFPQLGAPGPLSLAYFRAELIILFPTYMLRFLFHYQ